ncbi:MAG: HPP family protein, partial [Methylococcales bacterium]
PFLGGQLVSALVGVACAQWLVDVTVACAAAVGGSVLAMLLLRCLHPPGAATAIAPVIGGEAMTKLAYGFVLMPVGLNVLIMLIMAILINRWLLQYNYPNLPDPINTQQAQQHSGLVQRTGISEQDLQQALQTQGVYMDVTPGELSKLLLAAQQQSFKRISAYISCADIMDKQIRFVEYGTEVNEAWRIMHRDKLKALPVLDRARRVIGIISWNDFFNCLDVADNRSLPEKFCAFVKRTQDVSTSKPEAVGHIMTKPVSVLSETAHIVELIPLMSEQNYGHVPIVNSENRLVGMVDQANLIAALYGQQLLAASD